MSPSVFKNMWRKIAPNPLDRQLKTFARSGYKKITIPWNRGLGDIPLGLYALAHRIRTFIPDAEITFMTRSDLKEGFELLEGVNVREMPTWKRGVPYVLPQELSSDEAVIENPDPNYWLSWQIGKITPRLKWDNKWDLLAHRFKIPQGCLGIHLQTETAQYYGYDKNWGLEKFKALFSSYSDPILLFGLEKTSLFASPHILDLRGELSLKEMLSIIKNRCHTLLAPDSGVLNFIYYLDTPFPIHLVSLWADPNQGILKQNVASPNPLLTHTPLFSSDPKKACCIPLEEVQKEIHPIEPYTTYVPSENVKKREYGSMGCLILAGGQGSRLGGTVSKGLIPFTPIKKKTLLQLFCEKTKAASQASGKRLPLAIMTSPLNHEEILEALTSNHFFGLEKEQVDLFSQEMLPFLDEENHQGPDGNGHALKLLWNTGIGKKWRNQGIQCVNVIPIDNSLADPFDGKLCAFHLSSQNEVTIKSILRTDFQEKIGVVSLKNGKVCVQEYSELSQSATQENSPFILGSIGLFCFSLDFIEKISSLSLPLHLARKKISSLDPREVWKCERFIFDTLLFAEKVGVLAYPRQEVYSPLKNATGDKSLETARKAFIEQERRLYKSISGLPVPQEEFELDPSFYYSPYTPEGR